MVPRESNYFKNRVNYTMIGNGKFEPLTLCTLRPSGTLLFSGLPMIIWQKNKFLQYPLSKTAEKFVNWQQFKAALFDLREKKMCLSNKTFRLMWRPNAWIYPLEKKPLLYKFLLYFLQVKSFPPWMASIGHNIDKFWFVFWNKV